MSGVLWQIVPAQTDILERFYDLGGVIRAAVTNDHASRSFAASATALIGWRSGAHYSSYRSAVMTLINGLGSAGLFCITSDACLKKSKENIVDIDKHGNRRAVVDLNSVTARFNEKISDKRRWILFAAEDVAAHATDQPDDKSYDDQ